MTETEALVAAFEREYPNLQQTKVGRFALFQEGEVVGDSASLAEDRPRFARKQCTHVD